MTETELDTSLDQFLQSKGKGAGNESGHYRRNAEREVQRLLDWLAEQDIETFETVDDEGYLLFRRYARQLSQRRLRPESVQTYWNYISAWAGWCAREGYLSANHAQREAAKEPLPDTEGRRKRDQQTWSADDRRTLTRFVDERASDAIETDGTDAIQPVRDRALVFILAYTGIRGAEFLRDPSDDRRDGIRWRDVDLDGEQVEVLSKKQELDERPLTPKVVPALDRLQTVLDPPTDRWPVIPTSSLQTLYESARQQFRDEGIDDETIEARLDAVTGLSGILSVYRDYVLQPPSLTTNGARERLKTLTADAGVDLDDRHGYLAPHGGRRGVGKVLVETRSVEQAAEQLDNSTEVVEESYSHVLAEQQSKDVGEAFDEHDS